MKYDVIVVGLGAMGSASLRQAAKRSIKVLGIDRFSPPHQMGSSHGESRITRLAVGEGAEYLPFVRRSHQIWREIEAETDRKLLYQSGVCIVTPGDSSRTSGSHWDRFVDRTALIAEDAGIDFERLRAQDVRRRVPQLLLRDDDIAGFEPTGGVVLCEIAVDTQLNLARSGGATINIGETVTALESRSDSVRVVTDKDSYTAEKVIVTAGAWISEFFAQHIQRRIQVTRQLVYWFEVEDPSPFSAERFPAVMWLGDTAEEYFGVFPIPPGCTPGLKMLTEQFETTTDANSVSREVTQAEIDDFYGRFAARKIAGVTPNCLKSAVCLYTNTPDDHFVIDLHPHSNRVMLASPCSGHGFKHSAAIGEAMAQWAVEGGTELSLAPFAAKRLA